MASPRSRPGDLVSVTGALRAEGAKELRPAPRARGIGLSEPSFGATTEVAPTAASGAAEPIDDTLGPVVRRTVGDFAQVFQGQKMGAITGVVLMGLASGVAGAIAEFGDIPRGLLRSAIVTAPAWSTCLWLVLKACLRRRRFSRAVFRDQLAPPGLAPEGAPIRLIGVIEPRGALFHAPGTTREVVYARTLFCEAGGADGPGYTAREEIRAVPFRIRLDTGAAVNLPPAQVHLADAPERLRKVSRDVLRALGAAVRGPLFRESPVLQATLAPGDRVEVVGHLHAEVHVDGAAGPSRLVPIAHAMAAPAGGAIWVRRRTG